MVVYENHYIIERRIPLSYKFSIPQENGLIIPQTVINQIQRLSKTKEDYFRIALYIITSNDFEIESISDKLSLTKMNVDKALNFWEGAGLITAMETQRPLIAERVEHLTTREVFEHTKSDQNIATLLQESQCVFGETIGQTEANILVSLYINHHLPVDYLLTGLSHFVSQGLTPHKIRTIERRFLKWQDMGIKTATDIENYLVLSAKRAVYHTQVAEILYVDVTSLTYSEKIKIHDWYENFAYTEPIISQAKLVSGEKATIAYMNGVLKKWNAKGYRTVQDVLASEKPTNAVAAAKTIAPEDDFLLKRRGVTPKFRSI